MDTFLRLNGRRLTLSDDDAYDLAIRVAGGEADKAVISAVLRQNCDQM